MKRIQFLLSIFFGLFLVLPSLAQQSPPPVPAAPTPAMTSSTADWQPFTPRIGGFEVKLPRPVKERAERVTGNGGVAYVYKCEAETTSASYQVAAIFLPAAEATPDKVVAGFAAQMKQAKLEPTMKWLSGKNIALDGNPGIEFKLQNNSNGTLVWTRQYFAHGRIYETTVRTNTTDVNETSLIAFLDSFKVVFSPRMMVELPAELFVENKPVEDYWLPEVEQIKGQDLLANLLKREMPKPPSEARNTRGSVTVHLVVSPEGQVLAARAVKGEEILRPVCVEAVQKWVFRPILVSGVPAKVQGVITFNFNPQ